MRNRILLLALVLSATSGWAAAATLPGPAFPEYADPAALSAACSAHLASAQAAVKRLEAKPAVPRWLAQYDDINALVEDLAGPVYLLSNVHPEQALRDASEACELRWQDIFSTLSQNEALYRTARTLKPRDAIDREFLKQTLEGFEDAGVGLAPPQQLVRGFLGRPSNSQAFYEELKR